MKTFLRSLGCLMFHRRVTKIDRLHLLEMRTLSLWGKLCHRKTQRHFCGLALGLGIMMVGVGVAHWAEAGQGMLQIGGETLAWFIHGVGACPFLGHIEPLWHVFTATAEVIE